MSTYFWQCGVVLYLLNVLFNTYTQAEETCSSPLRKYADYSYETRKTHSEPLGANNIHVLHRFPVWIYCCFASAQLGTFNIEKIKMVNALPQTHSKYLNMYLIVHLKHSGIR